METIKEKIFELFNRIRDPRVTGRSRYSIRDILFIALCTYLSGWESFYEMEDFADLRFPWLNEVIGLKTVPSHDTFNRIFQLLNPVDFQELLIDLANRIRTETGGDIIAFDGKSKRGTGSVDKRAIHALNVWSSKNRIALAQIGVDEKSNEITAIPEVLDMLTVEGCVITADALNCQTRIAAKAIEKMADYLLPVKGNHKRLEENLDNFFNKFCLENEAGARTLEKSHGRMEERFCWQSEDLSWVEEPEKWAGLKSIGLVKSVRTELSTGEKSIYCRYYISSLSLDPDYFLECSRKHWEIENCLHWTLDVIFKEDENRARTKNSAKNLGVLRIIALNLLKAFPGKQSLKRKRMSAALSPDVLLSLLSGIVKEI